MKRKGLSQQSRHAAAHGAKSAPGSSSWLLCASLRKARVRILGPQRLLANENERLYAACVLRWSKTVALVVLFGLAQADTLELKHSASISGRILAEKEDQLIVDVGYTVLIVPRGDVIRIVRSQDKAASVEPGADTNSAPVQAKPEPAQLTQSITASAGDANQPQAVIYSTAGAPEPERSMRELVNRLGEAVVQVRTPSGQGSGFFVNQEGYLITNFHVVEGETQISVEVFQKKSGQFERHTYRQVRIVAMNKFADLALLKVEDPGAPRFQYALLAQADTLAVGERVFAIGNPMGLERTVTEGIVSSKTRQMQGDLFLQTTAQINPGNSGGPLFNMRGEVVGVTNMKMTFGEGLGFAIPVHRVRFFLNNRDAFAYDNDNPSSAYRYLEPPRRVQKTAGQPTN